MKQRMRAFILHRNTHLSIAAIFASALLLVLFDGRPASLQGWVAYSVVLGLGFGLIFLVWRWIQPEDAPGVVFIAAITALAVRILVGLILVRALPVYGYDENAQRAGYVYFDAYKRDTDAWARAKSDLALVSAFTEPKVSDQYGGYLFISASVYRYLSPDAHRPMLVTIIGAAIAGLGTLLGWLFTRQIFGRRAALMGAWLFALYPEAVLLGASQMREPFLVTALAGALAAYTFWVGGDRKRSLLLAGLMLIFLTLPISPPFVFVLLITVGLAGLWEHRITIRQTLPALIFAILIGFLSIYFAARSWKALEGISGSIWQIIVDWWGGTGGIWRINLVTDQSLNLDLLLARLPVWSRIPFLVFFGLLQPFLPAAIVAPGAPIWRVIGIFRSLAWFSMLPFMMYAPIIAIRKKGWRHIATYFSIYVWVTALISSYRAPSYQWDNPRYRVTYIAIQAALVGWIWATRAEEKDPWVGRFGLAVGGFCAVTTSWYLGRYYQTPSLSLTTTLVAASALALLLPAISWFWEKRRSFSGE